MGEGASSDTLPSSSKASGGAYALLFVSDGGFRRIPLPAAGAIAIGREDGVEVVVKEATLSRRHAMIHGGDPPWIEDLGSTNGTRVMQRPLHPGEQAFLPAGTVVELGDLIALIQGGADPRPPAAAQGEPSERSTVQLRDPRMGELYRRAEVIAQRSVPLIVLGETGVGKDRFAAAIHALSPRAARPLLRLNCAALPESLLESELFGHERGAFTGAVQAKPGLLESADGSTVFLDEVGELSLVTQAKLLRVLEDGEVWRLGSVRPKRIDIRIIAATNRSVRAMAEEATFRQDLYYRLAGIEIEIPPLRERPADLEALAEHFVAAACAAIGRPAVEIREATWARLRAHPWPGNIRELRNVVERAVLFSSGAFLDPEHVDLPAVAARPTALSTLPLAASSGASAPFYEEKRQAERQAILDALERCRGNQSRAAALLGMPRRTFVKRLSEYGIDRPRKGRRSGTGG